MFHTYLETAAENKVEIMVRIDVERYPKYLVHGMQQLFALLLDTMFKKG